MGTGQGVLIMNIITIKQHLEDEFSTGKFLHIEFPMLTQWGCPTDTVHSAGLNYYTALGRQLGYWAVSEYPVSNVTGFTVDRTVRSDICWFTKPDGYICLLGEFEHFNASKQGQIKLRQKAENLVIAHHMLPPGPRILLLMVWAGTDQLVTGLMDLVSAVRGGFRDSQGNLIPALPGDSIFLTGQMLFSAGSHGLICKEVLW